MTCGTTCTFGLEADVVQLDGQKTGCVNVKVMEERE